jgi:hypothetical protein
MTVQRGDLSRNIGGKKERMKLLRKHIRRREEPLTPHSKEKNTGKDRRSHFPSRKKRIPLL